MAVTIAGRTFPNQWFNLWMPWFSVAEKTKFLSRMLDTGGKELLRRHWGSIAPKFSEDHAPRFYIMDMRGLFLIAGHIRYLLREHELSVQYRGQARDFRLIPSIYRIHNTRNEINTDITHLDLALADIAGVFDVKASSVIEREGLAQHYGLPTRFLDTVDHLQSAAWFAYNEGRNAGMSDDAVGYIQLIAYHINNQDLVEYVDLRKKSSEWLRPHVQQGYVARRRVPHQHGDMYQFHVATFVVPRVLLKQWSGYEHITRDIMMPNANEDQGLAKAVDAARILRDKDRRINFRDPHVHEIMKRDAIEEVITQQGVNPAEALRSLHLSDKYITYLGQCQMTL